MDDLNMAFKYCPLTKHSAASSISPSWNLCWFCKETVYMDMYQYFNSALRLMSNSLGKVELTASVLTVGLCNQLQHFYNMSLAYCPTSTLPLNTWILQLTGVQSKFSILSHSTCVLKI